MFRVMIFCTVSTSPGSRLVMADYFDIGASIANFGTTPMPTLEEVYTELEVCAGCFGDIEKYKVGLAEALEAAEKQIYGN